MVNNTSCFHVTSVHMICYMFCVVWPSFAVTGEATTAVPGFATGMEVQDDIDDAELQQALLQSHASAASPPPFPENVATAPSEVKKLLLTVVSNLQRSLAADCDLADVTKFRQLNDEVVRKRAERTESAEAAYTCIASVLQKLGFLQHP